MELDEEVTITIKVSGVELSTMKVAQLKAHLEKRCHGTVGKKKLLKNKLERILLQERVLEVSS